MVNFSCHALSVRTFDKRNKLKKKKRQLIQESTLLQSHYNIHKTLVKHFYDVVKN